MNNYYNKRNDNRLYSCIDQFLFSMFINKRTTSASINKYNTLLNFVVRSYLTILSEVLMEEGLFLLFIL